MVVDPFIFGNGRIRRHRGNRHRSGVVSPLPSWGWQGEEVQRGGTELERVLDDVGVRTGDLVGVAVGRDGTVAVAADGGAVAAASIADIGRVDSSIGPRWAMWSHDTAIALAGAEVRLARAWDLVAVHRLLFGGWSSDPGRIWARLNGLSSAGLPEVRPPDLFHQVDPDDAAVVDPLDADGYVRADWVAGAWADSPGRVAAWATLARRTAMLQQGWLDASPDPVRATATARSESAAELLCAELALDGLPIDLDAAERIIAGFVGPRPRDDVEAARFRDERDALVLRHAPADSRFDLRSPGQVKSLLRRIGIEVPDTRAWRLEALRDAHPLVEALLAWRKAERVATTYGYAWLDEYVRPGPTPGVGRLCGEWWGSDGAAGRMTATAGLHNMPADMRGAVVADDGWTFVRADLGQIEPRVLAAVSADAALARASAEDDMYVPVARQLGVDRATAKVAVLGAMYGQTTGHGAQALRGLQQNYPVAMAYLDTADRTAQVGTDVRTFGGRLVRMSSTNANESSERDLRSRAAARGRYGRNAMVQGAAAEFFKLWAVTVRARIGPLGAHIVLCLHDELLVHTPLAVADQVAALVDECLREAAHRWAPPIAVGASPVRFLTDLSVIRCWADAKE